MFDFPLLSSLLPGSGIALLHLHNAIRAVPGSELSRLGGRMAPGSVHSPPLSSVNDTMIVEGSSARVLGAVDPWPQRRSLLGGP